MKSPNENTVLTNIDTITDTIIPIDKPLIKFHQHLSYTDRTIFSAKFGDGKTFFLNEFFIKYSDEFEVIKLFPVNYQVEDNKDIFELIKRDILLRLLANDQIENDDIIDDFILSQYYLFNNGADILLDILSVIPKIKVPAQIIQKSLKHFTKFKHFKEATKKQTVDIAKEFLMKFDSLPGSNEYDGISCLITKCIQKIKECGKKVVLLIEDLDRIDPAHLFRILNVLTAHIDRNHILVDEYESKQYRNKFDFDRIITVFDYSNTQKIFHHFYGPSTSFEGYINKFISHHYFSYSIKEVTTNYVTQSLSVILDIPAIIFENVNQFRNRIETLSVREIESLLKNTKDEIIDSVLDFGRYKISTNNKLSRFLVILKRLEIDFNSISKALYDTYNVTFMEIINVGWYLTPRMVQMNIISIPYSIGSDTFSHYEINPKIDNGLILDLKFSRSIDPINYPVIMDDVSKAVTSMMEYIK